MNISEFFLTAIEKDTYHNKYKDWGNVCFKELRYWLKGQDFIYRDEEFILKPKTVYKTTIQKIYSLIIVGILFFPGLLLNSISYSDHLLKWRYNRLKVYLETENALKMNKRSSIDFMSKSVLYNCDAKENGLNAIPDPVIAQHILPNLETESLHIFAQSCVRYYKVAYEELQRRIKEKYEPFSTILKEKLFQIPFISAKGIFLDLVESNKFEKTTWRDLNQIAFLELMKKAEFSLPKEYSEMSSYAICRLKNKDQLWLVFRLVIRESQEMKKEAIVPFVMIKGKWRCIESTLPYYLSLFFQTFNSDKGKAQVLDYLKRLLNNEPVGLFHEILNNSLDSSCFQAFNPEKGKAQVADSLKRFLNNEPAVPFKDSLNFSYLKEGPVAYLGGTPIVMLWSN